MLVEPDRDDGANAQDEAVCEPRLPLGQRPRAGFVHAVERSPPVGKVAVEVDPACVAACVARPAVGVEDRKDPEMNSRGRLLRQELRDGDACRFVAVHAADDEDGHAVGVAALDERDGTPLL